MPKWIKQYLPSVGFNQFKHPFTVVYKTETIHCIYLPGLLLLFIIPGYILHLLPLKFI